MAETFTPDPGLVDRAPIRAKLTSAGRSDRQKQPDHRSQTWPDRRRSRACVRNPMLALPGVTALLQIDPQARAALRPILLQLADDARGRADESWRRHKAPMAAYWKAVAVYAGHLARVLR